MFQKRIQHSRNPRVTVEITKDLQDLAHFPHVRHYGFTTSDFNMGTRYIEADESLTMLAFTFEAQTATFLVDSFNKWIHT